jgi:hypothetical protein
MRIDREFAVIKKGMEQSLWLPGKLKLKLRDPHAFLNRIIWIETWKAEDLGLGIINFVVDHFKT